MSATETLQPEAGDDRDKHIEIQRLNEMYYGPDAEPVSTPGEIMLLHRKVGIHTGHILLQRRHIKLYRSDEQPPAA
jgi:hypothetical protein